MANYRKPCDDDCYAPEHDKDKDRHAPQVVLSCGNGNGLTLPVSGSDGRAVAQPILVGVYTPSLVIGSLTLDTRGLEDPHVKVDFTSMINFSTESTVGDFELRLIFQLSRSCDNGSKIPLSTWIYEKELNIDLGTLAIPEGLEVEFEFKDPFAFTWCECLDCGGCCVYLVEIIDITADNIESASITNVGFTGLAVGEK